MKALHKEIIRLRRDLVASEVPEGAMGPPGPACSEKNCGHKALAMRTVPSLPSRPPRSTGGPNLPAGNLPGSRGPGNWRHRQ